MTLMPSQDDFAPIDAGPVLSAARAAAERLAPVWPLQTYVAVNPFMGLADARLDAAARAMAAAAGARATRPREDYARALAEGRILDVDLEEALSALAGAPGLPDGVAALRAAAQRPAGPAPTPLSAVSDAAWTVTGRNWTGFVTDRVSVWASGHFDAGQMGWAAGDEDEAPYVAWRAEIAHDYTPRAAGLRGVRAAVATLPRTAEETVVEAARRLGVPEAGLTAYFHRLLMSIGGWAAHARRLDWEAARDGGHGALTLDMLAIRLAWEVALLSAFPKEGEALAAEWAAARTVFADPHPLPLPAEADIAVDCALQTALDAAARRDLAARFARASGGAQEHAAARPALQAAFCIDVRSEVFRRALEATGPGVQTLGFAGFFGFPVAQAPFGEDDGGARCPVLLAPAAHVREAPVDAEVAGPLAARADRARRLARIWNGFRRTAVSSFAFVEGLGLTYASKIAGAALGRPSKSARPGLAGVEMAPSLAPETREAGDAVDAPGGRSFGLTPDQRLAMAEGALRGMSLTQGFARLVVLAGHGSTTRNNPHAAGLDCGACGGHAGDVNARVAAAALNDPQVRRGLADRGIEAPEDVWFLAALHDTTTDEVALYDHDVPDSHRADVDALRDRLAAAARTARAERAKSLPRGDAASGDALLARAFDWSETRPEWGLAGCAAFIAAPRRRTAALDLGGRAFLHDYDWQGDEGFGVLELIMTAPMVVASWISLQYYGSSVDPKVFGAGDKTLHNVVAGLGVIEGAGGDLRVGLPLQSVHDGERLHHEPLRLQVVIEAPTEAMSRVIEGHSGVRDLLDNGWLSLTAMDGRGCLTHRYAGDLRWEALPDA
ncbi:MAG: DUF2309 domain-containing protein, partial [Pseudomonadota bacterium]